MQDRISINGVSIAQPTKYKAVFATTSTDDSDRDMSLVMHNTPIGSVEGYDLEWEYLTPKEASDILRQVLNRPEFTVHYFDLLNGAWTDGKFYASNYEAPCLTLKDGMACWEGLSFGIRGIYPR